MSLRALHDFELALVAPTLAMTRRGLRVDEARRAAMLAALEAASTPLEVEINQRVLPHLREGMPRAGLFKEKWCCRACRGGVKKRVGCAVCGGVGKRVDWRYNPASATQTRVLLYDVLKYPGRTLEGRATVAEDALKSLLSYDAGPRGAKLLPSLLAFGKHETMRSILERMEPADDGRIRTWYNIAATETGRFGSSETWLEPASTNLQNLPLKQAMASPLYDVRRCIVPDEGEVFLYADLSQAEARVVAALCGDRELLERWQDADFDVHVWTAAHIFNKDEADVTKQERFLGKVARHALNYGMGWATFQRGVNADADVTGVSLDAASAKRIVAAYHTLHPALQGWWRQVGDALDRRGTLTTVFGRRRTFYGRRYVARHLDDVHKEAIAFEPQSTVADLLNRGLLRFWQRHDVNGPGEMEPLGSLLAQVHDAILVGAPKNAGLAGAALSIRECLEEELVVNGTHLTVPCEIEVCETSWAEGRPVGVLEAAGCAAHRQASP